MAESAAFPPYPSSLKPVTEIGSLVPAALLNPSKSPRGTRGEGGEGGTNPICCPCRLLARGQQVGAGGGSVPWGQQGLSSPRIKAS